MIRQSLWLGLALWGILSLVLPTTTRIHLILLLGSISFALLCIAVVGVIVYWVDQYRIRNDHD